MVKLALTSDARYSNLYHCFAFYAHQIVELTATLRLDSDDVADKLPVIFDNAGPLSNLLNPYGTENTDWYPVEGDGTRVIAYTKRIDALTRAATLRVLVVGPISTERRAPQGATSASISLSSIYRSLPIEFDIFRAETWVTSYPGLLTASEVDQTPSSSQGNYLYYRLQVTADGTDGETQEYTGLPNMLVRLTASEPEQNSDFLTSVLLYKNSAGTLCIVDQSNGELSVDLVTDAVGLAELYVCAKGGKTACSSVTCDGGVVVPDIGPILVADFDALRASLSSPQCDAPVNLRPGIFTDEATIPNYQSAIQGDRIFLFCNGRFQCVGVLPESLELQLPFQITCLRSKDYSYNDLERNSLYYVAARRGMVSVSSLFSFDAIGKLPEVKFDSITPVNQDRLIAPIILEAADDWPINCDGIAEGLTVRVPINSEKIKLGDLIVIQMTLNGYRIQPDEPVGISIPMAGGGVNWPESLVVTSLAMEQRYIDWRFQSYHFHEFGQLRSMIGDSGDVGILACRYAVQREDQYSYWAYCSETRSIGLDTIPPDGQIGLAGWVPPNPTASHPSIHATPSWEKS